MMNETASIDGIARRPRLGGMAIGIVLAFVIGVALMWFAMRGTTRTTTAAQPAAAMPTTRPVIAATPQVAPSAVDPLTLATRESALAAQIASLETRAATIAVDSSAAAADAGRAEAILIAFAARRALDRGVGLGYLEEQLRTRFGATQPDATLAVIQASRDPVTIESLRQALDRNAAVLTSGGGSWWDGLGREISNLVVLHDAGSPSPVTGDRIARARRMLDAGQVEPALAEIDRLPGADQVARLRAAAQRYVEARRALDTLESAAILGSIAQTPIAQTPIAPPPVTPTLN